jgi:hypothetical protein
MERGEGRGCGQKLNRSQFHLIKKGGGKHKGHTLVAMGMGFVDGDSGDDDSDAGLAGLVG